MQVTARAASAGSERAQRRKVRESAVMLEK
jgi:hypothetical protein